MTLATKFIRDTSCLAFFWKIEVCILVLKQRHFADNKLFRLLNKNYASYKNLIICNEFGNCCHIIITQIHNLTNTVNRWMLAKIITALGNNQTMTASMDMAVTPANWRSLFFLQSINLLKLALRLWNGVIIMWYKIPNSLAIV